METSLGVYMFELYKLKNEDDVSRIHMFTFREVDKMIFYGDDLTELFNR